MAEMIFSCVGVDVREWPLKGPFSVDNDEWRRNEVRYLDLMNDLSIWQNEYQLIEGESDVISEVLRRVNSWLDCNVILVEYPIDIVRLRSNRMGYKKVDLDLNVKQFKCRGIDVCDVNSLTSILHHPLILERRGNTNLFSLNEVDLALELAQFANILDQSHAPFALARLWSLK